MVLNNNLKVWFPNFEIYYYQIDLVEYIQVHSKL